MLELHASCTAVTDPLCGRKNKDKTAMDCSSSSSGKDGELKWTKKTMRSEGSSRGAKTNVSLVAEPCIHSQACNIEIVGKLNKEAERATGCF